jgi:tetratricopeptide (TPR) repeat protein
LVSQIPARESLTAKALRQKAARLQSGGDLAGAFQAYEAAVALAPKDPELLAALASLASQLEMHDHAVQLWAHLSLGNPAQCATTLGYARALIAAARFNEAVDVLKAALQIDPEEPRLWTTLGLALTYEGRASEAFTFFDEGVRLGPTLTAALYNRGLAWCDLERFEDAEADFAGALKLSRKPAERATIEFSIATSALARGDLSRGWALYERRLSPDLAYPVIFQGLGRRAAEDESFVGRSVLVLEEQGIGDEVLFANILPDLIAEIGPAGRLVIGVEPRLVDLFRRSFPSAEILPHATERVGTRRRRRLVAPPAGRIDIWTPIASLLPRYRPTVASFPGVPYLRPDPARVGHWRAWLGDRPAIGLTWRSGMINGERQRLYPSLPDWAELLRIPSVQFVNLQYGDSEDDVRILEQLSGAEIRQPPGLDIKNDIDDLAALCAAVQAVVSVQNATGALAGACGANVVFVASPGAWTQLGQPHVPWYARAQACAPDYPGDWKRAVTRAKAAVQSLL